MKWYRRVQWRLIEMGLFNSFVIYRRNNVGIKRTRQLHYRLELANVLVKPLLDQRNNSLRPNVRSPTIPERLIGKHFPCRVESRGRCRVCGNKRKPGQRKLTTFVKSVKCTCVLDLVSKSITH